MTWMTVVWPVAIVACVTIGLVCGRTELRTSPRAAHFLYSLNALAVALYAGSMGGVTVAAETGINVPAFVVKSWRTIDGLPQNSVMALAQTADGYLWLGTRGGLARFDGVRFTTYGLADGLKAASIYCLAEDGQSDLWIGTLGGGLSRWRDGGISTLTTADGLAHNDVTALTPAEIGGLWVGSKGGLQHFGAAGFTRVGEAEGIRGTVMALATDRAGGLWVGTFADGLFYCKDGHCELVEGPPTQPRFLGYSLVVDTEGALWVSIGNGMVLRRQAGEWTIFDETNGLPFSFVRCLAQGAPGEIWAASSEEGLYVFRGGRFHAVPETEAAVRSVRMSRDGVIWVGTYTRGLCRLTPGRLKEYPVGIENDRAPVKGLVEESPGRFWVATDGTGLHQGSLDQLERVAVSKQLEKLPHLTAGLRMSDGALYFGGAGVLLRREPTTGEIRKLSPTNNVTALCEGADAALWLGTREGQLLRWVDNTLHTVTNGTFPPSIFGLVRGPGSSLWVATSRAGLFRWEGGQVQSWTTREGLPTDAVRALHQDDAGTLWIGTAGGGLAWLAEGRLHSVNSRQGLGDDFISQILEDDHGALWLGCNLGIFRVSKRELQDLTEGRVKAIHPLALGEADGMLVEECAGGFSPAGLRSQSGTLYFTTLLGVVAVDPAPFGSPPTPPAVLIEGVILNGKPLRVSDQPLSLPPGSRELEIHYTAFNYTKPEQIRFRHRLGGREGRWTEADRLRSVRYSQLPPGHYRFRVTAANQDGHWNETGASLAFTVLPFYWQTTWFRLLAAIGLIGGGAGSVWAVVHGKLRRHQEELAHQRALAESQQRVDLAASATNLGIWERDLVRHEIWASDQWRALFGFEKSERLNFDLILQRIHPDDREHVRQVFVSALDDKAGYEMDYRIVLPNGRERWIASRGRPEFDSAGKPILIRGVSLDITSRKLAEEEARNLSGRLIHAQEDERRRIARDLHDDLSQRLALISVELEMFGQKPPTEREAIAGRMQEFSGTVKSVSSDVHRLAHELHPAKLDQLGLVAAVRGFCKELAAVHQVAIAFAPRDVPRVLSDEVALCLYRVTQEALQNAVKHSDATGAKVELTANEHELQLVISDDGHGFDPQAMPAHGSLGIVSMRERVRMVQGEISVQSRPGEGTRIEVRVPIMAPAGGADDVRI